MKADPAVNDTVPTTPKTVRLWFSEPVELGAQPDAGGACGW